MAGDAEAAAGAAQQALHRLVPVAHRVVERAAAPAVAHVDLSAVVEQVPDEVRLRVRLRLGLRARVRLRVRLRLRLRVRVRVRLTLTLTLTLT